MGKRKQKTDDNETRQAFPITKWAKDDRPREKLLAKGVAALSDAELLAIILGSGWMDENAVELAKRILADADNNLNELGKSSVAVLKKNKGIGEAKAISIIAALELGRRRNSSEILEKKRITTSDDVFRLFHPKLSDLPHEEFWLLFLNRSNRILDFQRLSVGGLSGTPVDIRLIMKMAIERLASGLILCHNHPSGNLKPSNQDVLVTKKVKEGGAILDISLIDHIIIADNKYYSFLDEDVL